MATVTATEARTQLPALLDRVENGEEVIITRHGKPIAVLGRARPPRNAAAAAAIAEGARLGRLLDEAAKRPLTAAGLAPGRAEELIREIRADRDRDPWDEIDGLR